VEWLKYGSVFPYFPEKTPLAKERVRVGFFNRTVLGMAPLFQEKNPKKNQNSGLFCQNFCKIEI